MSEVQHGSGSTGKKMVRTASVVLAGNKTYPD
jgi:hypothetical protein